MSSGVKCKNCGSTDIEVDNARGDAVCTNCGSVLEDNLIVSEVQFEEAGHGSSAIGQFVSADSSGGATNYGYGKFQVGSGNESREVTIKKAKNGITHLCQQLHLTQHYIDTALRFFKMALMRHLTRGRRNTHIYAACVYITCRTEGTSHLLIDISDVLQICSYELGRTYLKLSNALCISIPAVDPCLYIMRFANKLQFAGKSHQVSMTALRIVQRMKKDSMHSGRRPTGLCGAALLIAARMHDFSRTIGDIVNIVKIHESTLRKRLTEFADTPSGGLTFDEFMTVDLEAEQDPPAFKMARKKDRERIQNIGESELSQLQRKIEAELDVDMKKKFKKFLPKDFEETEGHDFILESNMEAINEYLADDPDIVPTPNEPHSQENIKGLKPDVLSMCTPTESDLKQQHEIAQNEQEGNDELSLEDLDDDEINGYIMTEKEAQYKNEMWTKLNSAYLKEMQVKQERIDKEREEGKPEKKRRRTRKRVIGPSNTAGEAIEKMLQEKKISTKINYDILKTLTEGKFEGEESTSKMHNGDEQEEQKTDIKRAMPAYTVGKATKKPKIEMGLPLGEDEPTLKQEVIVENDPIEEDEDIDPEPEPEPEPEHASLKTMLDNGDDEYGFGDYDEEDY